MRQPSVRPRRRFAHLPDLHKRVFKTLEGVARLPGLHWNSKRAVTVRRGKVVHGSIHQRHGLLVELFVPLLCMGGKGCRNSVNKVQFIDMHVVQVHRQ